MSSRLRSLDSKISFFAFADIITAVSGVLIFVALLLATDLGKPTSNASTADSERERQLQQTLAQQVEVDAQNDRLQELVTAAETSPSLEKLQIDINQLRAELAAEQAKQAQAANQVSASEAALAARDKVLGFDTLKTEIHHVAQETEQVKATEARVRTEMNRRDQQIATMEARLLKIQEWAGQVWLIPDQSATSKEPIVVFVDGTGATVQQVDHPEGRVHWDSDTANEAFRAYLEKAKSLNQYVVFEIKPSGISLFQDLVKTARDMSFDVGYDALEENKVAHLSSPPAWDDATPATGAATATATNATATATGGAVGAGATATAADGGGAAAGTSSSTSSSPPPPATAPAKAANAPSATTAPPPPPKPKSWWERLLEWLGLRAGLK